MLRDIWSGNACSPIALIAPPETRVLGACPSSMASEPRPARTDALRRAKTTPKRSRIEVQLPPKIADYVPGSGPPLQRISLLPPQDSTAYIIDRFLLPSPGLAADGKPLPRRMTYVIGWTDLPAARLLVPAMEVLSYVAPLALETWEWDREMEMEAERAKLEEERKQKSTPEPGRRRKGRPPINTKGQAAIVAEPEQDATPKRLKKGVMSLSTPQKATLEAFEGLSDDEGSPSQQLEREQYDQASALGTPSLMDVDNTDMGTETGASVDRRSETGALAQEGRKDHLLSQPEVQSQVPAPISLAQFRSSLRPPFHALEPRASSTSDTTRSTPAASFSSSLPVSDNDDIPSRVTSFKPAAWSSSAFAAQNGNGFTHDAVSALATSATPDAQPGPKAAQKRSHKKKKQAKPEPEKEEALEGDDGGWEVKRLEGIEYYDVEGRGVVRYFFVRWEGDWPPDQNPTWEPEDNLPAQLVRSYMKKGKKRRASKSNSATKPKPAKMRQSTLPWAMGQQYNSVSDAFSDRIDTTDGSGMEKGEATRDDFDAEKEFFVVE